MKKILIMLTALLPHILAAEKATPADPFNVPVKKPGTGPDSPVSRIDLDSHHNAYDAIKQIIAGLPPEGRKFFVVDVPEEELAKMPISDKLNVRNVPISVALKYLEPRWPLGYKFRNNEWHISKERADDIVAVNYRLSKLLLGQLGIEIGPSQTFSTKKGRMWPPESEWGATYTTLNPDAKEKPDADDPFGATEMGVLQLRAARSYHEEFSAVLLLKERGYYELLLDR